MAALNQVFTLATQCGKIYETMTPQEARRHYAEITAKVDLSSDDLEKISDAMPINQFVASRNDIL